MRSRVFYKFLVSYAVVLLIPLIIGSIAYIEAANIVKEESNQSNMAFLRQFKFIVDVWADDVQKVSEQITLNSRVRDFIYLTDGNLNTSIYSGVEIIDDFSKYKTKNSFIKDFYIYFMKSDVIITSNGKYNPKLFYEKLYRYGDQSFEKWKHSSLKQYYFGQYMSIPTYDVSNSNHPQKMITYMKSISIADNSNPDATITVLIDGSGIEDMLQNMSAEGKVYIVDPSDHVIMGSDKETGDLPAYDEMTGNEGVLFDRAYGGGTNVIYMSSNVNDWKYVALVPQKIFYKKVIYIRDMTIGVVAACLLVGTLIAYFLAYRNYNPIREIMRNITNFAGKAPPRKQNEMEFIKQVVMDSINEGNELRTKLTEQLPVLKANFLLKLLKGRAGDPATVDELIKLYNIRFVSNRFVVILFCINEAYTAEGNKVDHTNTLVRFTIMNIIEEVVNRRNQGYVAEIDEVTIALVTSLRENMIKDDSRIEIDTLIKEVREFLSSHYQTYFTACVGNIYNGLEGIGKSYKEAYRAMEYIMVRGINRIIYYNDICSGDRDYYYPIDIEKELINHVLTGDNKKAALLLDRVFEENFVRRNLASRLSQCMFFDIMSTAIKTLQEINIDFKDVFGESFDPLEELLKCQTVEEIHKKIIDIYSKLCLYVNQNKRSHNEKLKNAVAKYLEGNYTDECLNQTVMAEELGITPSYLSCFFKEQFGENMVDYINKLKVKKAKELMTQDGNLSMSQIASMVGCNNDKALIRIFKKYEGVTPGKYRDSALQQ